MIAFSSFLSSFVWRPFFFFLVARISIFHLWLTNFIFVIAKFLWGLGLPEDEAECGDVYGLDDELLDMVPKPVLAVLFLYPITEKVFLWIKFILMIFMDLKNSIDM